ncbi:MAG: DUF447 family protein [Gemmataceae bacterium]|nr:DUF447 family protein [Gemmata sp.]MDW8198872.1 DUF447 family protein [Gemmataceae bacterium]
MALILEALVTTLDADGSAHLAPMGPRVDADSSQLTLRLFPSSQTYRNLCRHPQGVIHITDDALLLAQAAIGALRELPPVRAAERIRGFVLVDCCRYLEFVVRARDERGERHTLIADVVHTGRGRDWFGFNRAKHAIVEAAIMATRLHVLPPAEVAAEFAKLRVIVDKTGGPQEQAAMALLEAHRQQVEASR